MEDINVIQKVFFRFLKENGVFARCIEIYKKSLIRNKHTNISDLLIPIQPYSWIQSSNGFCSWCRTVEGDMFWWGLSLSWQCDCVVNNYIADTYNKQSYLRTLINNINDYTKSYKNYATCNAQLIVMMDNFNNTLLKKRETLHKLLK
jgi:hypothetical protein